MPYIEQEKLQELIEDVNILDVVDYLGIECHKEVIILCYVHLQSIMISMLQTVTVKTVANVSVAKHVDILRHQ